MRRGRVVLAGAALAMAGAVDADGAGLPLEVAAGGRLPAGTEVREGGTWRSARRAPQEPGRIRVRSRDGKAASVRVRYLRMTAVGDVNFGDGVGAAIGQFGVRYPWRYVGRDLRAADLTFGNLECAVSRRGYPQPKTFTFRGRPGALRAAVRRGGFDVFNLANNHAGDYGDVALRDTLRYARRYGVAITGAGRDAAEAYRPTVVEKLGLKVAFVGFSTIEPFSFAAGPDDPGTAWGFPARVRRGVQRAARQADVVIATFHWGIEYLPYPTAQQTSLAQVALDAGATAVIGAHPHVPQRVTQRGRRLVAYSLGNFVFTPGRPPGAATRMLELRLARGRVADHRLRRGVIVGSRPRF